MNKHRCAQTREKDDHTDEDQSDWQTNIQNDRPTVWPDWMNDWLTDHQSNWQTNSQTDRPTIKLTNWQTDKPTVSQHDEITIIGPSGHGEIHIKTLVGQTEWTHTSTSNHGEIQWFIAQHGEIPKNSDWLVRQCNGEIQMKNSDWSVRPWWNSSNKFWLVSRSILPSDWSNRMGPYSNLKPWWNSKEIN